MGLVVLSVLDSNNVARNLILDQVGNNYYPVYKLTAGELGQAGDIVSSANPLPVTLPSGFATAANQSSANTLLAAISEALNIDGNTNALRVISHPHHEIHGGSAYFVVYSVPSLGVMATPDDMITLTWTTPNTAKWGHFQFACKGTSGWRVRLIEAPTGGAENQTGQLPIYNNERNSGNTSGFIALDSTSGEVSYDATLATGGNTLIDQYIEGSTGFFSSSSGDAASREEIILKQNTKYQVSLYGTDGDPATIKMAWYEHTNI